jgi:hypothetical protein
VRVVRPPDAEIFVLTLRAEAHVVPAIVRLRALLKAALRQFGLRCISIKAANHEMPGAKP